MIGQVLWDTLLTVVLRLVHGSVTSLPFWEIMTDRPTNRRRTNQQADKKIQSEVTPATMEQYLYFKV